MTEQEIQRLFVEHPFGEAKRLLIEEIEKCGFQTSGNENVFELKAIAMGCFRPQVEVGGKPKFASGGNSEENSAMSGKTLENTNNEQAKGGGEGNGEGLNSSSNPPNEEGNNNGESQNGAESPENGSQAQGNASPEGESGEGEEGLEGAKNGNANEGAENEGEGENGENSQGENKEQGELKQQSLALEEQPKRRGRRKKSEINKEGEKENQKENSGPEKEKTEEELESEASKLMEEARKKIEEASKMREEKRKKEEEEKKRKEKERQSKSRHFMTDEVVKRLKCLKKAFLVGPAGTGKSTLAMCACRELFNIEGSIEDVIQSGKFAQISFSPDTVSADMLGFTDVNGVFHETEIIRVFRDGGLILFDEMDDADASLLVKLNTMLANRVIPIPGGMVTQNPNTYIVGTANTYGKGGNSMYVGRSRLDAATLDRWKMATINVEYDRELEKSIIGRELAATNVKLCHEINTAVEEIRNMIGRNKWKQICSTRFVIDGCAMGKAGYSFVKILDTFLLDWDETCRKATKVSVMDALKSKTMTSEDMAAWKFYAEESK